MQSFTAALHPAAEGFGRKDVIYNLDNKEDPEAIAAIKEFQRQQFQAASKGPTAPPKAEADLELTSQVERKYKAAQIVESGIQVSQPGCRMHEVCTAVFHHSTLVGQRCMLLSLA